ncbi:hypothetical protein L2E82_25738 [Cichorium intybus]|uniref:Uncharacterized protein n=1 Tax=Cichorium intybus TaxID=13427 RepID=A0ACB9E4D4_CICIN|nr:hypothetical protein L2E82_25738 [Cichorium intybus]
MLLKIAYPTFKCYQCRIFETTNGGGNIDHSGNRVADIDASINAEKFNDVDEVVDVGIDKSVYEDQSSQGNAACTNEVVEDEKKLRQHHKLPDSTPPENASLNKGLKQMNLLS